MDKLKCLRRAANPQQLTDLLSLKLSQLTHVLYGLKPETQYRHFEIPKKQGGMRRLSAPSVALKSLQTPLACLLQDCLDEIIESEAPPCTGEMALSELSHGFMRGRSILSNAQMHLNKNSVLNIDLDDFFGSFNFGRVRGFFISNPLFQLNPTIASLIAQIACHQNKLPQGSPCSPVIANLIARALDRRLATLASRYSCTYSRYADDLTFSSDIKPFPQPLLQHAEGKAVAGTELQREIQHSGFRINPLKTRIQYRQSRQDVTGLVVNDKVGVKAEYWRKVRAQCHLLFKTGQFFEDMNGVQVEGNIHQLAGKLNFIDQIDRYHRQQQPTESALQPHGQDENLGTGSATGRLNIREAMFSRFLYYRSFYAHTQAMLLGRQPTDSQYIHLAIKTFARDYPELVTQDPKTRSYRLRVQSLKPCGRTRFLLNIHADNTWRDDFIRSFEQRFNSYQAPAPVWPVILLLDPATDISPYLRGYLAETVSQTGLSELKLPDTGFIQAVQNLYLVFIPKAVAERLARGFDDNAHRHINSLRPLLARLANVVRHYQAQLS